MKYSFFTRGKILVFLILFFGLILIAKLFLVQVVQRNFYSMQADRQYSTPSSNIFERGTIFFQRRNGQLVSAGTQIDGFKMAINPTKIVCLLV